MAAFQFKLMAIPQFQFYPRTSGFNRICQNWNRKKCGNGEKEQRRFNLIPKGNDGLVLSFTSEKPFSTSTIQTISRVTIQQNLKKTTSDT